MSRKLLTVEDRFDIKGRGLIVVPGPLLNDFPDPATVPVELRKPDGTTATAELSIMYFFLTPPPQELRWGACSSRSQKVTCQSARSSGSTYRRSGTLVKGSG